MGAAGTGRAPVQGPPAMAEAGTGMVRGASARAAVAAEPVEDRGTGRAGAGTRGSPAAVAAMVAAVASAVAVQVAGAGTSSRAS